MAYLTRRHNYIALRLICAVVRSRVRHDTRDVAVKHLPVSQYRFRSAATSPVVCGVSGLMTPSGRPKSELAQQHRFMLD